MLQFARRRRWFLPLMVLLTVVAVQQLMLVDGADESRDAAAVSVQEDESETKEGESYNDAEEEEEEASESQSGQDSMARRTKKRVWLHNYGKRGAALLPLFFVGLAAAFAAAGYVFTQKRKVWAKGATGSLIAKLKSRKDASPADEMPEDMSPTRLQSLMSVGKRTLPPAVALGIVTLIVSIVVKKYGVTLPFMSIFGNATTSATKK